MPEIGAPFVVASILFGALLGYGLGRSADDRTATLSATVVCAVAGGVAWLASSPATTAEAAGTAMTIGGLAATLILASTGRRREPVG